MRMLPFFKPKKGFMVAGGGLETTAGGGGGGGGGGISIDTTPTQVGTLGTTPIYSKRIILSEGVSVSTTSGAVVETQGYTNDNRVLLAFAVTTYAGTRTSYPIVANFTGGGANWLTILSTEGNYTLNAGDEIILFYV